MSFPDGPPTPDRGLEPARHGYPVTQGELVAALRPLWAHVLEMEEIINTIGERQMATQADVDALTASVSADVAKIQAEIAALGAANPALDLSGLQAAVASLDATANPAPPAA